jgi:hypothetical protein
MVSDSMKIFLKGFWPPYKTIRGVMAITAAAAVVCASVNQREISKLEDESGFLVVDGVMKDFIDDNGDKIIDRVALYDDGKKVVAEYGQEDEEFYDHVHSNGLGELNSGFRSVYQNYPSVIKNTVVLDKEDIDKIDIRRGRLKNGVNYVCVYPGRGNTCYCDCVNSKGSSWMTFVPYNDGDMGGLGEFEDGNNSGE